MTTQIKHLGRMIADNRPVFIVFRTIPDDHENALIVYTDTLTNSQFDEISSLVRSPAGQGAFEFGVVMFRSMFNDGTYMLQSLHVQKKLVRVPSSTVEVTPGSGFPYTRLDKLNEMIAKNRGIPVEQLAYELQPASNKQKTEAIPSEAPERPATITESSETSNYVMSDEELAKKYRSDAMRLSREATALRRMADSLSPPVKKQRKTKDVPMVEAQSEKQQ